MEAGLGRVDIFCYCDLQRPLDTVESRYLPLHVVVWEHPYVQLRCGGVLSQLPSYLTGVLSVQQTDRDGIQGLVSDAMTLDKMS